MVLDVGTGPGRVPLLIAQRCPSLTVEGIDLSEQMIARATQAASLAKGGRLTYRVADVRALPYPDGSIDLVVETGLQTYDYQALIPVIRAAGGSVGNWEGGSDMSRGRIVAAATEELFRETIDLLSAA